MGPLIPLFWTSSDVSSGFQSQSGQPYSHLFISNGTAKRKLAILAFLCCGELVKNPIRCIMLNSTDDLRLSNEIGGKTAYQTYPMRMNSDTERSIQFTLLVMFENEEHAKKLILNMNSDVF